MRRAVLLFDIDGTLLETGGSGRRAFQRAFAVEHGRDDACSAIQFGGMTDRAIARQGLRAIGVDATEERIDRLVARYVELVEDELARDERCRVHRGVPGILAEAARWTGVAIGLGTGNVKEGAALKLAKVGLADRFAFGGFGCDAEDRAELLRIGASRGAARLGARLDECRVVVIGDTPRDVAAARAIGASCVAVATGRHDEASLASAGADVVVPHLEDDAALAALVRLTSEGSRA